MPGARGNERATVGIQHQIEHRRRAARLELAQKAAEALEHRARRHSVQCVRAQPAAELPHDGGGMEAAADDVPDRHAEPAVRKLEGVVPVAAELGGCRGQVAAGERHRRQVRKPRHQAALERIGEAALPLRNAAGDRESSAVGGALKQVDLVVGEPAMLQRPYVQDADHAPLHEQGHPDQ